MPSLSGQSKRVTKLKTGIYLLVCLLLAACGTIILAVWKDAFGVAISTSLIAGAIASIGFTIIRYFDDIDISENNETIVRGIAALDEQLDRLESTVDTMHAFSLQNLPADDRRIFERHPRDAVQELIEAAPVKRDLEIDALGMSLQPFFEDVVKHLLDREKVTVRLLVQDPEADTFDQICSEQGRDRRKTTDSIASTIRRVLEYNQRRADAGGAGARVEIRCFSGNPAVTLTRINKTILVRARMLNEANFAGSVFYERYDQRVEPRCYNTFSHYFERAWDEGRAPAAAPAPTPAPA